MVNNSERFLSKINKTETCWIFCGGISSNGYGVFWMNGKSENAHKASYILFKGVVQDSEWVLHTCDNKQCVNPNHLYLGNRTQNVKDAVDRNRMATGEKHGSKTCNRDYSFENNPFSKISKANCIAIKNAIDNGLTVEWISQQTGLHISTIYRAKNKAKQLIKELNNQQ